MGKINDYMNKYNRIQQNNERNTNVKKDKLNIKGVKDVFTLLSPNASKYRLSKNQKKFQIKGRVTIAAIAATLAVSGVTIASNVSSRNNNNAYESQTLQKDAVLEEANSMLKSYIYGDNQEKLDNANVEYNFDKGGCTSIVVRSDDISFRYDAGSFIENSQNNEKINDLLSKMIQIERNDNPSQKDLASLLVLLDDLKNSSFKLQGKHIVASDERDTDLER